MRDIEGKAAREAASECGQRASFKLYVLPSYFATFFSLPLYRFQAALAQESMQRHQDNHREINPTAPWDLFCRQSKRKD